MQGFTSSSTRIHCIIQGIGLPAQPAGVWGSDTGRFILFITERRGVANCDLGRAMKMLSLDDDETNAVEIYEHSLHDGGIEGATRKLHSFCRTLRTTSSSQHLTQRAREQGSISYADQTRRSRLYYRTSNLTLGTRA